MTALTKNELSMLTKERVQQRLAQQAGVKNETSTTLVLSDMHIEMIENEAFDISTTNRVDLRVLDISKNSLRSLDSAVFRSQTLVSLHKLVLSFNQLGEIRPRTFETLVNLEELEITDNLKLRHIGAQCFTGLARLKRLILARNSIESIDAGAFAALVNLELLVLGYNSLTTFHCDTFASLSKLKRLNLRNNRVARFDDAKLFRSQRQLTQIIFSANLIEHFDERLFANLASIDRLFMHTNRLTVIGSTLFAGLATLRVLDIGNNRLSRIEPGAFDSLANLQTLDMSKNQVETLDIAVFARLARLDELNLSKNQLSALPPLVFAGTPLLRTLHLDFNQITALDVACFEAAVTRASFLELYCNTLRSRDMRAIQSSIIAVHSRSFVANIQFVCDQHDAGLLLSSPDAYKRLETISLFSDRYKKELYRLMDEATERRLIALLVTQLAALLPSIDHHIRRFKVFMFDSPEFYALKFVEVLAHIVRNWSNFSLKFCKALVAAPLGLRTLFAYLNSDTLRAHIFAQMNSDSKYSLQAMVNIFLSMCATCYNLTNKESVRLRRALCEHDAFGCALRVASIYGEQFSDIRLRAYMIVANLLDESINKSDNEWRKQLEHISPVLGDLVTHAGLCAERLTSASSGLGEIERCPFASSVSDGDGDGGESLSDVAILDVNGVLFYLTDFLDVLYNFAAVSDEIKRDIYATHGMCKHLRTIIMSGNGLEKEHALKLLCQLCFDKRNARDLASDEQLCEHLNGLLVGCEGASAKDDDNASDKDSDEQLRRVRKNVQSILFVLNEKCPPSEVARVNMGANMDKMKRKEKKKEEEEEKKELAKHVMISYNSKSREMCLKIKSELEAAGHSVWIDVESIYGSSLEAMAEAIEKCKCVLICITEKYKESNYCRLEAEYLMQQKKPFIPLLSKSSTINSIPL